MTGGRARVAEEIRRLAGELPVPLAEGLAAALTTAAPAGAGSARSAIHAALPQPHYRALAYQLLDAWRLEAPDLTAESVGLALSVAARGAEAARNSQVIELVWTGPRVETIPPRRTDQALLQVIDAATTTLTIVSFVAYKVPAVAAALAGAARRGVTVRLVLEDAEVSQGKVAFDALRALGPEVAARSTVFVWPLEQRPKDPAGHHGSLHAKCAVADGRSLLISSANLTEHAFTLNLELGLLLQGGVLPGRVEEQFDRLVEAGILRRVSDSPLQDALGLRRGSGDANHVPCDGA